MKKFCLVVLTCFVFSCSNTDSEEELIRQCFQTYKSSAINDNGTEAVKVVDKRTIRHYEKILELTKTADSTSLQELTALDKFFILTIRYTIDPDSIMGMTGRTLFIYAINNGMIGKEGVMKLNVENIAIEKDFAIAEFTSENKNTGINVHFYKESGQWKFDLSSFFEVGNLAFKKMLKECPVSENECIINILEITFGKNKHAIWQPIIKS